MPPKPKVKRPVPGHKLPTFTQGGIDLAAVMASGPVNNAGRGRAPQVGDLVLPGTPALPPKTPGEVIPSPPPEEMILSFSKQCSFVINHSGVRYTTATQQEIATHFRSTPSSVGEFPSEGERGVATMTTSVDNQPREVAGGDGEGGAGASEDGPWLLLKGHSDRSGEGLGLRGEDFLGTLGGDYRARYLAQGGQGSVWLHKDFVFKRITVSQPRALSERDSLPLCAEVGYALRVAYLQELEAVGALPEELVCAKDFLPIHGIWYLRDNAATGEPAIYLVMDKHGMSCQEFLTGYMTVLPASKVQMKEIFWDPDIDTVVVPDTGPTMPTGSTGGSSGASATPAGGPGYGGFATAGGSVTASTPSGLFPPTSFGSPHESLTLGSRNPSSIPQEISETQEREMDASDLVNGTDKFYGNHAGKETDRSSFGGNYDAVASKNSIAESISATVLQAALHASTSVMELDEVQNNKEYVEFKKGLRMTSVPEEVLCILAYDVLKALATLHEYAFLMHNDIKADNILLSKNGRGFTLIDFGCALPVNEAGIVSSDIVELVSHGNGEYRAPEGYENFRFLVSESRQASPTSLPGSVGNREASAVQEEPPGENPEDDGKATYCARSDVYSFAALLLELRAGRKPNKVTLNSITIAHAQSDHIKSDTKQPKYNFVSKEELTEKFNGMSHASDRVQCVVLKFQPERHAVLRGVLDKGEGSSISLISDDGEVVPLLSKCGTQMVHAANLLSVERETNFGRVDVINPEDVLDLNASETFKDFLLQALALDWKDRPSAKELMGHPFLTKAGTYRKHLKTYMAHLSENKKKAEDTTILNLLGVTDTPSHTSVPFTMQKPGGLSYLEKARLKEKLAGA